MKRQNQRQWCSHHLFFLLAGCIGITLILGFIPASAQTQKALIDLNTASEKDLETIKGVGPATAKKIIAGRPYKSVADLKKAGIPEKTIESMKPHVTVGAVPAKPAAEVKHTPAPKSTTSAQPAAPPPSARETTTKAAPPKATTQTTPKAVPGQKVNINTATKEQLEGLPEIGPVKAQAIIDGRPYKKAEDIMKVKGIKEGTFNKIKDYITVQ